MNVDQARRAFQAADAEVRETRERIEELEAEREEREEALQRLKERRREALAAGESPRGLRASMRRLEAEAEDLAGEIEALTEIADGREARLDRSRRDLAEAEREEVEREGAALLDDLREALATLRGVVGTLDTLAAEHRQHSDAVRSRGGPGSAFLPFGNRRDWRGFREALDALKL